MTEQPRKCRTRSDTKILKRPKSMRVREQIVQPEIFTDFGKRGTAGKHESGLQLWVVLMTVSVPSRFLL